MSKPNPLDFRVLPIPDTDLIPFYIGSDTSKPFWVKWGDLKKVIESLSPPSPPGSAAWGSILTGTGVASQTDLVTYLNNNYYPLSSNPASYVTASQLTTALLSYVTTSALATALLGYVPTSRTITINGVTFDLSADRSWTVSGGGSVNSVNSGININVDNTDPANPIINSLSDRYKTTSTTSNSVSNGSKSFTVDINLSYIPLQEILVVFDVSNHMHGTVTSYNPATGALVVDIKNHTGSGTYTAWTLNLDGTPVDALTGSGTANEIAYFTASRVLASLPVVTYPNLIELSYIKGLTSSAQSQIDGKQDILSLATQKLLGRGTAGTGNVEEIGLGTGFSIDLLNNLQYSAPTPVAAKFYQQDNWSNVGTGNNSIEYVASLNKIYITNISSNNVTILNSTTGEPIATVAATNCVKCKYIASVNQIYVTSSSVATIIRIDGSTNLPLSTISVGVTVNGLDILEYSATKVFITCGNASGSIMVVNPLLGTVAATVTTSVPSFPIGMALNTNVSSLQFNKIVIGAQSGICIFDPTTNAISTTVANPSSAISSVRFLTYSTVDDKYYVASAGNSRLVVLSIASATTFTATFLSNQQAVGSVVIDEINDYLFMFPLWSAGGTNIAAKMFKKTTLEPIVTITPLSQGGAAGSSGLGVIDLDNGRIFVVGRSASLGNVSILKYL